MDFYVMVISTLYSITVCLSLVSIGIESLNYISVLFNIEHASESSKLRVPFNNFV